jgi:predicted nuclease with TOPRIM domain
MKTSIRKIVEFQRAAELCLKSVEGESKLSYAITKVAERLQAPIREYNDLKEDIEIDNANVDEKGSLLFKIVDGKKHYDFTKDGLKKSNKEIKALFDDPRFDVKGHFCAELPEDFNEEFRPFLEGFVLAPAQEKE